MDDIVKKALAKWPNVSHCTGWLLLDRRGNWRMRDEAAQSGGELGTPIRHPALLGFINRNYQGDKDGQWYFQNGPQRVYVELAYTPYVVRMSKHEDLSEALHGDVLTLCDHTGAPFVPCACYLDDAGGVLFVDDGAPARVAVLHDYDLALFSEHIDFDDDEQPHTFVWRPHEPLRIQPIDRVDVPVRFHFEPSPAAVAAARMPTP
ncbi:MULTISPECIES: DUF2946 family protein [Burkholderiaceae]|uniref:DUF2946 family protein n=1 Tax=Burkholderiaceae TaxID=119060 RepID=UPI000964185C|nr:MULTISPECIES: DUF2946 family protein [Burkholderiaceae]MCG1040084.1 DUF2946 family protein [Mycetohabitans sp. B7]SIT72689.1 Protein of unknown function [Burkholderia sp. b14]